MSKINRKAIEVRAGYKAIAVTTVGKDSDDATTEIKVFNAAPEFADDIEKLQVMLNDYYNKHVD